MSAKRGNHAAGAAHSRTGGRRTTRKRKTEPHAPGRDPSEHRIDETVEESFPASDPPAHGVDPGQDRDEMRVEDAKPAEGEREPDDDEGGIGGEVRRPEHEGEDDDPLERGED